MFYYVIYGITVTSDIEIEGAYKIEQADKIEVQIRQEQFDESYMELSELEQNNEQVGVLRHYEDNWACLRFKKHGLFMIENGNTIKYQLFDWHESHFVSQIFLCFCMSVLLMQRKAMLIHGSAILYKGKTLIISGDSGAGKSSLTNEIMSRGYLQMSDDIVAIGQDDKGMIAYPSFPVRKLCADFVEKYNMDKAELIPMLDADREKYGLVLKDEYYNHEAPLGAMVIIKVGDVDEPALEEITGSAKLKYLTENFFRQDVYEQVQLKPEEMMRAIKVAGAMPIYVLKRPKNKMTVKQQADLVEKNIVLQE